MPGICAIFMKVVLIDSIMLTISLSNTLPSSVFFTNVSNDSFSFEEKTGRSVSILSVLAA